MLCSGSSTFSQTSLLNRFCFPKHHWQYQHINTDETHTSVFTVYFIYRHLYLPICNVVKAVKLYAQVIELKNKSMLCRTYQASSVYVQSNFDYLNFDYLKTSNPLISAWLCINVYSFISRLDCNRGWTVYGWYCGWGVLQKCTQTDVWLLCTVTVFDITNSPVSWATQDLLNPFSVHWCVPSETYPPLCYVWTLLLWWTHFLPLPSFVYYPVQCFFTRH